HLGRAPDEGEVVECEVEQVGGRVQRPQIAIQQERVDRARRVLAARQYGLERVARSDVFEDAGDVALERRAGVAGRGRDGGQRIAQRQGRELVAPAQPGDDVGEARVRRVVEPQSL